MCMKHASNVMWLLSQIYQDLYIQMYVFSFNVNHSEGFMFSLMMLSLHKILL